MTDKKWVTVEELAGIIRDNPGCEILFIDQGWWIILPKDGNEINTAWEQDGDPLVEPLVTSEDVQCGPFQNLWRAGNPDLLLAMAFLLGVTVEDN
jgi:hypothetical protein